MLKQLTDVPAGIQALEAVGTVTTGDYRRAFAPLVAQARQTGSRMRLLYQFGPAFERITPGAVWADTRLGLGYVRLLDGYDNDGRTDAVAWLDSLPACADVSARDMAKAYIGGASSAPVSLGGLVISKGVAPSRRKSP